ncbi:MULTISPECIES: hypothetical protein [Methylophaga]|uniref:hypothetical protein n=1 Tax=Methylophaga TaxID=40222 RepID=UPI001CF1B367|nr:MULTISPECIES: hypothetical protein [Methylophaga]MCB2426113.1 hypothetical protein [Methylophaga pinxianii]MDO8827788.1 hypothetical protein [Methylophaga sp.]UPH47362.1 hypothetical protein LGT42_015090 [Methylophaga pinxianii]
MFNFVNDMVTSPAAAFGIYLVAGLILFHDMKRIRWYAMSLLWVLMGTFDRGFLIETTMLGFAYLLTESFFGTYYQLRVDKAEALKRDK